MSGWAFLAVLGVGTLVGLDVASVPQLMFSRPLVAAVLGATAAGRPLAGLAVGAVLELFALETLPVGAARVPDWGPGAVAAGAVLAVTPQVSAAGAFGVVLAALASAWLSGWSVHLVRRANARSVTALAGALDAGDLGAVKRLLLTGLSRDAIRGAVMTSVALAAAAAGFAMLDRGWSVAPLVARLALASAGVGVGLWSAWQLFGHGPSARWLAAGLGVGTAAAVLWA